RVGRGASLAAEERAGDLARGVLALLDVDREREEVEVVLGVLAGRRRAQQRRVVVERREDGAGGLLGEAAGLEADGAGAEATVVDLRLGVVDLGTLHGCPPCGEGAGLLRRSSIEARGPGGPRATTEDRTLPAGACVVVNAEPARTPCGNRAGQGVSGADRASR